MSPRPKRTRKVIHPPGFTGFKPFGCPETTGNEVKLLLEEYEAIRLADYEKLNQVEAAEKMGVSRPTFSRIHENARGKIAKAFVEATSIIVEGGNIESQEDWLHCPECHTIFRLDNPENQDHSCPVCKHSHTKKINTPEEAGSTVSSSLLDENRCVCPKCNHAQPHIPGEPCRNKYCPNCGISMIRENSPHHIQLKRKLKNIQ